MWKIFSTTQESQCAGAEDLEKSEAFCYAKCLYSLCESAFEAAVVLYVNDIKM